MIQTKKAKFGTALKAKICTTQKANERTRAMANPHEKLAESLEVLRALQERGIVAVRSGGLTRTHRERLVKNGFLQEVMKGWDITYNGKSRPMTPSEAAERLTKARKEFGVDRMAISGGESTQCT